MIDRVHANLLPDDRYIIIVDGKWERYCKTKTEAERYASMVGNSMIKDVNSGKLIAVYW